MPQVTLFFCLLALLGLAQPEAVTVLYQQAMAFKKAGRIPVVQAWKLIHKNGFSAYLNLKKEDYNPVFKNFQVDSLYAAAPVKGSTSTVTMQPTGLEIWPVIKASVQH